MVYMVFKKARYSFLMSQRAEYESAVASGTVSDFLNVVYARYARRFPIEIPLSEEPLPEILTAVDDNAPHTEQEPHCVSENLSEEERIAEEKRITERRALIMTRKKQIASWFSYRYMRKHHPDPRSTDPSNPFTALLFSLTGKPSRDKPRQKSAVNCWSKSEDASTAISAEVRKICIAQGIQRNQSVGVWNQVAQDKFALLTDAERKIWEQKAKDAHAEDIAAWKALNEGNISTKPEDRQRCIEGLIRLGQLVIEAMSESMGMNIALFAGGPEPANGGRLSIISLYAGTNNAEDPLNFGQAERDAIVQNFFPVFTKFLQDSFTPEECRRRTFQPHDDIAALDIELEARGGTLDEVTGWASVSHNKGESPQAVASVLNATLEAHPTVPAPTTSPASTPVAPSTPSQPIASQPIAPNTPPEPVSHMFSSTSHPAVGEPTSSAPQVAAPTSSMQSATTVLNTSPAHSSHPIMPSGVSQSVVMHPSTISLPVPSPPVTPLGSLVHLPTCRGLSISTIATSAPSTPDDSAMPEATQMHTSAPTGSDSGKLSHGKQRARQLADAPVAKRGRTSIHRPKSAPTATSTSTTSDAPTATSATPSTDAPVAKRGRTSIHRPGFAPTATSTSTVSNAPTATSLQAKHQWFAKAIKMLDDNTLGEGWSKLVAAWIAFKVHFKCVPDGPLPCNSRPSAIGDWIARARSPGWRPTIVDSRIFGDAHVKWWTFLQPEWRVLDDGVFDSVDAGDLKCLKKPGANGLLSVLASLFFWGTAVKAAGKKSERWNEYVADCTHVIEHLSSTE